MPSALGHAAPGWVWWCIVNLAFGCYAALTYVPELQQARTWTTRALRLACVFAFAMLGLFVYLALRVIAHIEDRGLYRSLSQELEP